MMLRILVMVQLKGWYSKLQRDEVVAEWRKVQGKMTLHVHCHISGGNLMHNLIANLRFFIFRKELPVVSNAFTSKFGARQPVTLPHYYHYLFHILISNEMFLTILLACTHQAVLVLLQVLEAFRHGDEELLKEYPGKS